MNVMDLLYKKEERHNFKDIDYHFRSIVDDIINFGLFTITYAARSMSLGVAMDILEQTKRKGITFMITIVYVSGIHSGCKKHKF